MGREHRVDFASLMTPEPLTVAPDARADVAARLLDEHHVRHLPVVEGGNLVGLLTDRDLLAAEGSARVSDLMHAPVVTVSPQDSPATIAAELALRQLGCVVVVEDHRLRGVVSQLDVLRAFVRAARDGHFAPGDDPPIERLMEHPFETIEQGATLGEASDVMRALRVRHLPVVEGARVVGMLSDRDLRRGWGKGLSNGDEIDALVSRPAITVEPELPASAAAALMAERKLGALPVLRGERAVGLLSLSNVLDHCARELRHGAM
jgi:CBS domain-containing protein